MRWLRLRRAYLLTGDSARAEKFVRQVLANDASNSDAWLELAKTLDAEKNVKDAEQAYGKAAELAPALTDAHLGLAEDLAKQGKLAEAAAACEEAIKFSPDLANSYVK